MRMRGNSGGSDAKPSRCATGMKGQDRADRRAGDRQDDHRSARSAAQERHPAGAHDEDDERLGGERLDEPARTELAVPSVQHDEPSLGMEGSAGGLAAAWPRMRERCRSPTPAAGRRLPGSPATPHPRERTMDAELGPGVSTLGARMLGDPGRQRGCSAATEPDGRDGGAAEGDVRPKLAAGSRATRTSLPTAARRWSRDRLPAPVATGWRSSPVLAWPGPWP
jgi:hypothetical protein